MGDFTTRLTAEQYDDLKRRADNGEVNYIAAIEGYFNDPNHYQQIKSLCGYTHPLVVDKCKELGRPVPSFTTVPAVRKWLATNCGRQLCDICVAGRKVFLCEQLTYDKAELDRHLRSGDETGPLAESGFKGHPVCKFCRQRFYDSAELYKHMESAHEHCFLCRRLQPGTYVYYRHYRELEDHFRKDHHLCPHPGCLDKKFVVFASEQDLKRHMAGEHGDELKMSKAQRREANALPIPLQFREGQGVVIGGGDNVSSRHGRRQGPGGLTGLMRHSRSEGTMQGSGSEREGAYRTDTEAVTSVTFRADEFPSMASTSGGVGGPAPGWYTLAAVRGSQASSGTGEAPAYTQPSSQPAPLKPDDFPSLGQLAVASKASTGGQASTPRPSTASSSRASQQANVPSPSQRPASAALPASPTVNSKCRCTRIRAAEELRACFQHLYTKHAAKPMQASMFKDALLAVQQCDSRAPCQQAVEQLMQAATAVLPQQKKFLIAAELKQAKLRLHRANRRADEVLLQVFALLDPVALAACLMVCRSACQTRQHLTSSRAPVVEYRFCRLAMSDPLPLLPFKTRRALAGGRPVWLQLQASAGGSGSGALGPRLLKALTVQQ
ncbi:uncharacterized protein HaLaN_21141, partial [Haematococcus lacustris]